MCAESDQEESKPRETVQRLTTSHARARQAEGKPIGAAFRDAQRARQADVFMQPDRRYVVRGSREREHIFDLEGTPITTLRRSRRAHAIKIRRGEPQPITPEDFVRFQELFG